MASKRKFIELTIEKKIEILDLVDKGESQRKLAERFGVAKSTIGNITKNKDEIVKSWLDNCSSKRQRRLRRTANEDVNVTMLEYLKRCCSKNVPITGPLLQSKAKEIANQLGISDFQASCGWLNAFRKRNNISFRVLNCGEPVTADSGAAKDWKIKLTEILKDYPAENQFNADETGLFYRQLPTKSAVEENEKCLSGELANQRLTVLLCCSASGEKLRPLVIGNSACPGVFKKNGATPETLPVIWRSNKKAWMNSRVFEEWVKSVNLDMEFQQRKIILLVDNMSSHTGVSSMSHVQIKFLPPNLTSLFQPLNQGIICAVKQHYRKLMLQCLITKPDDCRDVSNFSKSITVYDAIRWLNTAWQSLDSSTIIKSFHTAGFPNLETDLVNVEENQSGQEEMKSVVSALPKYIQDDLADEKWFSSFDNDVLVHEDFAYTAEDIFCDLLIKKGGPTDENLLTQCDIEESDGDDDESSEDKHFEMPPVSFPEALASVKVLQHYASVKQPELTDRLMLLYGDIETHWAQSKIVSSNHNS